MLSTEKAMATHFSILAWKIPWTEEPGRPQSMGSQRDGHDWATSLHFIYYIYIYTHIRISDIYEIVCIIYIFQTYMKFYTLYIHIFISDMSEYTCCIFTYFRYIWPYMQYIYIFQTCTKLCTLYIQFTHKLMNLYINALSVKSINESLP